jgi:hypothetical protein
LEGILKAVPFKHSFLNENLENTSPERPKYMEHQKNQTHTDEA